MNPQNAEWKEAVSKGTASFFVPANYFYVYVSVYLLLSFVLFELKFEF
jgi:hypothetical protein